jgi:hypothetical protein
MGVRHATRMPGASGACAAYARLTVERQSAARQRRRAVGLTEPVKDVRREFAPDAYPGIRNADLDVRVHRLQHNQNLSVFLGELDGIREDIS